MAIDKKVYAISKKDDKSIASGFDHAQRTGDNTFSIFFIDGSKVDLTIPLPEDGKSIVNINIDADNHVICTMSDGSTIDAGEMPKPDVEISKEEGNALTAKTDGLYVGATGVEISKETGNIIQNKTDGLYAKADEITVDPDANNILENRTDGLYVPKTDLSGYVEVEDGKSLVANEDITQITANKTAIEVLNGDAETAGSVDKKLADAIAMLNKLEKKIIDHVPTVEEAKDNILYLVESETAGTYNQYMLIDGTIASLGSTDIDLDGYAKTEDVVLLQQAIVDKGKSLIVGEDGKVIVGNAQIDIVTEFGETPSDEKVPSEKLVKDSLDNKADSAIVTGHINLDVGSDLNTLVDYGTYRTTTKRIDRIDNVPVRVAGMLVVGLTGGVIYQTYKTIDDEMYIRSSEDTGATWADWKKVATAEDLADYVAIQQKAEDKGKALVVGEDGKLTLGEVATSDIGSVEANILGWNVPKELSLKNEVVGNKFIQKIDRVDLGTLDWEYRSSDGLMLCQTSLESKAIAETDAPNIYCSAYKALPRSGTESVANTDKSIALPNRYTIIHDSGYTDGASFKTSIKDTYLYYELATPITKVIDGNELIGKGVADLTEVNEKFEENADWLKSKNLYADTNELTYNGNDNVYVGGADFYLPKGEYIFSAENNYSKAVIFWFRESSPVDDNTNHEVAVGDKTSFVFNVTNSGLPISIGGRASDRSVLSIPNVLKNIMVRKSSETDDTYEPYRGKSNLELAEEISRKELELTELKMIGWNVPKACPIQNSVSGNKFTQRVGRVSLIDKTWTADGIGQGSIKVYRFEIPSNCKTYSNSAKWNLYVDGYVTLPLVLGYSGNDVASHDMAVGGRNAGGNYIEFSTTKYSTAEDFKAYMDASGLYLYYELATPITKDIDGNENPNMVSSKLERFVAPSTDAEVLALPNGIYSINVADVGTSLFPNSWGTLVVLKSGFVYGTMLYIGANAKMYFRNINNGAWREASWTALT